MKKAWVLLFAAVLAMSVVTPAFASTHKHRKKHHRKHHHATHTVPATHQP
jgi:hypothetical protein